MLNGHGYRSSMQEVHIISIGNGPAMQHVLLGTGPGPDHCPTSCRIINHFVATIDR